MGLIERLRPYTGVCMLRNTSTRRRQSAQSMTEFALILPVLMLILLGVVDFGRVFYYWTSMANAAREGARYGTTHPSAITTTCKADPNNIKYRVKQEAGTTMVIADSNIAVYWVNTSTGTTTDASANCSPLPGDQRIYQNPNAVRVDVNYDFRAITPLISNFWGGRSDARHAASRNQAFL